MFSFSKACWKKAPSPPLVAIDRSSLSSRSLPRSLNEAPSINTERERVCVWERERERDPYRIKDTSVLTYFALHGDSGLRFRSSFHSRGLSGAGARSIARLVRPCVWSILLMYACTPKLLTMSFFSAFFDPTKTGVCLLSFLLRSVRLTKTFLKPKKKGHASALPASVAGSSYLSSCKVKNKDRWTTNGIDRTVSVEQTERLAASSRKAWIEREGHFPCPALCTGRWQTFKPQLSVQSRTSKPDYTWTATSTAWEVLRTRCKQPSISFSNDEALRKIKEISSLCFWP